LAAKTAITRRQIHQNVPPVSERARWKLPVALNISG